MQRSGPPVLSRRAATLCEVTETPTAAITLSDKAVEKIGELLGTQDEADGQALRVAVRGGGCSGFQYALAFDRVKDDDNVFEVDGVSVVVDKVSMQFVFGSEVDYVEGLQGAGFQVNNPNVVAACGCGSSFQVKEDAAEQLRSSPAGYSICSGGDCAGGAACNVLAGCSIPSASASSPDSYISSTMSAPPTSSPLT